MPELLTQRQWKKQRNSKEIAKAHGSGQGANHREKGRARCACDFAEKMYVTEYSIQNEEYGMQNT